MEILEEHIQTFHENRFLVQVESKEVRMETDKMTGPKYQSLQITVLLYVTRGPGSSVGIVTGYGLDGPGIESRWGARFSAPVQTGPEAHPASCTMATESFPG